MSIAELIRGRLSAKRADQKTDAKTTWDQLVAKVYNDGSPTELSAKDIDVLQDAAEQLGIHDYPEQFALQVESLQRRDQDAARRKRREEMAEEYEAAQLYAVRALLMLCEAKARLNRADRGAGQLAGSDGSIAPLCPIGFIPVVPQLAEKAKSILESRGEEITRRFRINRSEWRSC